MRRVWLTLFLALACCSFAGRAATPASAEDEEERAAEAAESADPASKSPDPWGDPWEESPGAVAVYSLFLPGVGQIVNGDTNAGVLQLGGALALASIASSYENDPKYISNSYDSDGNFSRTNDATRAAQTATTLYTDLAMYSSYAAWRDAWRARGVTQLGYGVSLPRNDFGSLALAPFRPSVLSKPEVWAPVGIIALAVGFGGTDYYIDAGGMSRASYLAQALGSEAWSTSIGEEAFFRGVLNTSFSGAWGQTGGLVASSAIFAAAHNGTSGSANAAQAFFMGLYLGWVQQINGYDLAPSTAIHFWNNVISILGYMRDSKNFSSGLRISWGWQF